MRKTITIYLAICICTLSLSPFVLGETLTNLYPTAFERALLYFSTGRWDKVTPELNNALKEGANEPELLTFIGAFLSVLGDDSQATKFLNSAERATPTVGIYMLQGDLFRRMKNSKKAEEYYKKALKKQPKSVMAYIGIGKVREQDNKLNEALSFYLQALELNPERVETLISAGQVEYVLKKYVEASQHFAVAVEKDRGSAQNHLWYAKALYASGVKDKGLQQLDRAIELDSFLEEAKILKQKWLAESFLN